MAKRHVVRKVDPKKVGRVATGRGLHGRDEVAQRVEARAALAKRLEVGSGPETPEESRALDAIIEAFEARRAAGDIGVPARRAPPPLDPRMKIDGAEYDRKRASRPPVMWRNF